MRLSYVTVCVNYLDYLRIATHHNVGQFDDMVVVTSMDDTATINWIQSQPYITPVYTDAFYRNGATFNKGLALSEGLNALKSICEPEWVAIFDSDTFIPPDFRAQVVGTPDTPPTVKLDKEFMYGARRVLLPTFEEYERLWKDDLDTFTCPEGHSFGWLQMFHWQSKAFQSRLATGEPYPQGPDCREVDWKFRDAWGSWEVPYTVPRGNIAELPFRCFNLGFDGRNHFGRVTPPFVPPTT